MRRRRSGTILLLLVLTALAALVAQAAAEHVVVLTEENFDELTDTNKGMLIEFYAPWCGHCKQLQPQYEKVAAEVERQGLPIKLGKVDCVAEKALQTRFGIKSFPTILFLRDGEVRKYKSGRTPADFLAYIDMMLEEPVVAVSGKRQLAKRYTSKPLEHPVVFLFAASKAQLQSSVAYAVYESVARKLQGSATFLSTSNSKLIAALGGDAGGADEDEADDEASSNGSSADSSAPRLAWLTHGIEMGEVVYDGDFDETSLREWVEEHLLPLVSELSGANFDDVTAGDNKVVFSITDPRDERTSAHLAMMLELSKQYRGQFVFANVDGVQFSAWVKQFGVEIEDFPTVAVYHRDAELYARPDDFSTLRDIASVDSFLYAIAHDQHPWLTLGNKYSPAFWFKRFEKFLDQFDETQLMIGSVVVTLVFTGILFYACFAALGDENELGPDDDAGASSSGSASSVAGGGGGGGGSGSGAGADNNGDAGDAAGSDNAKESKKNK